MDRNGFAVALLLLFSVIASFSDASLLNNLRTFVVKRDSLPGSPVPVQGQVSHEKKPDSSGDTDTSGKSLDKNGVIESRKENKLDLGSENQASTDKSVDHIEGSKKVPSEDSDPAKKGSEEKKLDSEPDKEPKKEELPQPKRPEETGKEKEKQQSEQKDQSSKEEQKPGSESKDDPSQQKKSDPGKVKQEGKQQSAPPPPKDAPVTKSSDAVAGPPPPLSEKTQKKKEDKVEEKVEKPGTGTVTDETCDGLNPSCTAQDLVGCIKSSDGSRVVVLVQNKGESILKANVAEESSGKGIETDIPKTKSKLIPVSLTSGKASKIVVNGKCELPLPLAGDEDNSFLRFPTYDKLVNPVNGAYLVILTALIFGVTCACVKFSRRKRQGGGIPYQELEMGLPDSVSAADADIETTEGWDQGWDDDWDNHIKSPSARRISGNGLTARSPVKDGWDDSWDD